MNKQIKPTLDEFMLKIESLKEKAGVDISTTEDLSIAVMNLISLEEHFFFTGMKTDKDEYFDTTLEIREIRKGLLAELMPNNEGETWCISKHLLATSMRLMEVGTKLQKEGKKDEAKEFFDDSYKMFNLFFALRLKIVSLPDLKDMAATEKPMTLKDVMAKLVDCCN